MKFATLRQFDGLGLCMLKDTDRESSTRILVEMLRLGLVSRINHLVNLAVNFAPNFGTGLLQGAR